VSKYHLLQHSLFNGTKSNPLAAGWGICAYAVEYKVVYLYNRDAGAAARLVVGAFTVSPASGVVPASGQATVTVECAADQAGHVSEVLYICPYVHTCVCCCLFLL